MNLSHRPARSRSLRIAGLLAASALALTACGSGDGETDTRPQARQGVAPVEAREVGDEDADDESGFEAFAKADEEGGEHGRVFRLSILGWEPRRCG